MNVLFCLRQGLPYVAQDGLEVTILQTEHDSPLRKGVSILLAPPLPALLSHLKMHSGVHSKAASQGGGPSGS